MTPCALFHSARGCGQAQKYSGKRRAVTRQIRNGQVQTQASSTLTRILIRGVSAFRLGAALLLVLLPLASVSARVRHNDAWARQQFSTAERMREALNGRPLAQRTRHEYQRVIDYYRRVYFGSPGS